jgi:serine/threonine protein kinase
MQHLQPKTTLQSGKYRIERVLGQGGFGNTYVGYNTEFEETVAIKEFFMKGVTERDETTSVVSVSNADNVQQFGEQREKFKKEARRLRKLKNEHIVKVHDLFEENGTAYYVMDYIEGESLAERIKKTGNPFTEVEVRSILSQILEALKEVHQNEIWHLDLKPGNIMIDKSGNAYLIDFGASKQIRANGSMTTSTALCYTPGYAPNEQIGQMYDRFGPWTDIYALGATIYNLLTNKKPPMAIDIEEDEEDAFEFPTTVSDEMRKLVIWMMQPKRKARPQNVDEIIEKINAGETVKEKPIVAPEPEQKPKPEPESEETLLIGTSDVQDKPKEQPKDDEEKQTILVVSKKNQKSKPHQVPSGILPQRAIKVGDFIFEDGSYADRIENDRKAIGVLFSYYGGAHGQILSAVRPNETLSINGKELKWHEASIAEWVEVIQNLGHCKVSFSSWEYHFFSLNVKSILSSYQVKDPRYATRKSVSGVAYAVNLEGCRMTPIEDDNTTLPYIYISEF